MDINPGIVNDLGWNYALMGEVDHRVVKAPYIRLVSMISVDNTKTGVFDLRFTQPNSIRLPTNSAHSLEHMMAVKFKKRLPDHFINLGPMGCLTGFYLSLVNELKATKILDCYIEVLEEILVSSEVPLCNIIACGWAADHSLEGAKEEARKILNNKDTLREVY